MTGMLLSCPAFIMKNMLTLHAGKVHHVAKVLPVLLAI